MSTGSSDPPDIEKKIWQSFLVKIRKVPVYHRMPKYLNLPDSHKGPWYPKRLLYVQTNQRDCCVLQRPKVIKGDQVLKILPPTKKQPLPPKYAVITHTAPFDKSHDELDCFMNSFQKDVLKPETEDAFTKGIA